MGLPLRIAEQGCYSRSGRQLFFQHALREWSPHVSSRFLFLRSALTGVSSAICHSTTNRMSVPAHAPLPFSPGGVWESGSCVRKRKVGSARCESVHISLVSLPHRVSMQTQRNGKPQGRALLVRARALKCGFAESGSNSQSAIRILRRLRRTRSSTRVDSRIGAYKYPTRRLTRQKQTAPRDS